MSFGAIGGGDDDDVAELETVRGRGWPTVTQFSVFLENRVGALLEVVRLFSGSKVKVVGLSISDAADCCIVRMMLSHCEQGREILKRAALTCAENELIVVELPTGPPSLVEMCAGLIQGEINIHYAYPLIVHPHGRAAVALHVDNVEQAGMVLHDKGFDLLCEADLQI